LEENFQNYFQTLTKSLDELFDAHVRDDKLDALSHRPAFYSSVDACLAKRLMNSALVIGFA
jgi:hypothetical protein